MVESMMMMMMMRRSLAPYSLFPSVQTFSSALLADTFNLLFSLG
jgi:hypothetical protein